MAAPKNTLKAALAEGRLQRGLWLALGSETVTEIAGRAGFDWCLIDGEHAPFDPTLIRRQLMTLEATGTPAVVRVPSIDHWVLKQILDIGAQSIMVPMINSAAEARAAVAACRYPPEGTRGMGGVTTRASGYGARPGFEATANDEICLFLQVESRAALDDLEAIATTDGVDCIFIGPADLSADMGYRDNILAPPVWEAISAAVKTICAAGRAAGIIGPPSMNAAMIEAGVTFLGLGADTGIMTDALRALAKGDA
ncbi:MAG: HpcH/HpaI aldolase/citrate lyase family protein [Pseudomonadota bacterium]